MKKILLFILLILSAKSTYATFTDYPKSVKITQDNGLSLTDSVIALGLADDGNSGAMSSTDHSSFSATMSGLSTLGGTVSTLGSTVSSLTTAVASAVTVDSDAHVAVNGSAPSVSSCGTSAAVAGTDNAMRITVGTGGIATSCLVTFAHSWVTVPVCTITNESAIAPLQGAVTQTTLTITAALALVASGKIGISCQRF